MGTDANSTLVVLDKVDAANRRLTRREMMQRLLAGAGATAAWPIVSTSHPFFTHVENDSIFEEAEKLAGADWKPLFFGVQQNESFIAVAESIVPGSTRAQVNHFVDLLLSVDSEGNRKHFVDSLAAFEAESRKRFGKNFPALDDGQKHALLKDASDAAERKEHGLAEHFENLKGWISGAYYSSEVGMRELGWTGDYAFANFPGCEHPEGHT
jgi:Gluconate 2-dehydrogenase subunit 3